MDQSYSLSEVARLLGLQGYRIAYAHTTGAVPEPPKFCGKRAYTLDDVRRVAAHFGIPFETADAGEGT